jgi:hypothetical protein
MTKVVVEYISPPFPKNHRASGVINVSSVVVFSIQNKLGSNSTGMMMRTIQSPNFCIN